MRKHLVGSLVLVEFGNKLLFEVLLPLLILLHFLLYFKLSLTGEIAVGAANDHTRVLKL